jgi:hypothetical protein
MSKQINLFNPELLKQEAVFTATTMALSLGLLLVGATAIALYGRYSVSKLEQVAQAGADQLAQRKVRQVGVMAEFAPRGKNPAIERQIGEVENAMRALRDVSAELQGGQLGDTTGYAGLFKALARQSTVDLWLTGVSINGAGKQLGLQGRALEPNLVPAYISRLAREPVMQGKTFGSLQISRASVKDDKDVTTLAPYIDFSLQAEAVDKPAEGNK